MEFIRSAALACLVGLSAGAVWAQAAGGGASGPMGAGPRASAPGMGMGMGMGPGGGHGMARWGSDYTPGWTMMDPQERKEHQERMHAMKTFEECKAYHDQHHEQMAARAKERGGKALARPRHDPCWGMKKAAP